MQCLQADLDSVLVSGIFPAGVILITWEGQIWCNSTFPVLVFSQDCLLPGRPGKCQGIFRATGITEPDNVLSANSSRSINILSRGVVRFF